MLKFVVRASCPRQISKEQNASENLTLSYGKSLSLIRRGKDFYVVKSEGEVKL